MELCEVIFQITEEGKSAADTEFQNQIRRAAKSAPSLIAEGFVRFTAPEMVRYLRMALAPNWLRFRVISKSGVERDTSRTSNWKGPRL